MKTNASNTAKKHKSTAYSQRLLLESRLVFDGAMAATVADVQPDSIDKPVTDNTSAAATPAIEPPVNFLPEKAPPVVDFQLSADSTTQSPDFFIEPNPLESMNVAITPVMDVKGDTASTVIVVDPRADNAAALLANPPANTQILTLDTSRDGFQQVADYLQTRHDVTDLHLLTWTDGNSQWLGNKALTGTIESSVSNELTLWGDGIAPKANIVFHSADKLSTGWLSYIDALTGATTRWSQDTDFTNTSINPTPQRTEIVFIESNITDYQTLIADINQGAEVHLLNASQDSLTQIAQILNGRTNIDAIHLLSHGSSASLSLGSEALNGGNLGNYTDVLKQIGSSLSATGDILLYGCDVAQGDAGLQFITQLGVLTGADIAASTNLTGAATQGGDWVLEANTGAIETSTLQALDYAGVLANANAANAVDNITQTNNQTDSVTFNNTNRINAGDYFNGGSGAFTDTIVVSGTGTYNFTTYITSATIGFHDYEGLTISAAATVQFSANQFGVGLISDSLTVTGAAGNQAITVALANGGATFIAAGWTFTTWTNTNDTITITGGTGNDTITGSGQVDTITGSTGADILTGGIGNDAFTFAAGDSVLTIGGSGAVGTLSGYDVITDYASGSDTLNFTNASLVVNGTNINGADSTLQLHTGVVVGTHTIANGIITFNTATALTTSADVAAAVQYLQAQNWTANGSTVAFNANFGGVNHTFVFVQGSANGVTDSQDVVIDLQNKTVTAIAAATNILTLTTGTGTVSAPAASILSPTSDSGILLDNITSDNTPTITGAIGSAAAGATITFTDSVAGSSLTGATTTVLADGSWSYTPTTALTDTVHSLTVKQTVGGTPSAVSTALSLTVDTAAPVAPTLALTTDTGSSATDGVTNVGTMTVVGVEATASWQYSTDSGTTWSAAQAAATTTFTVPVGSYAINAVQVRQTDLAGNLSATTGKNTAAITVDTAAPVAPTLALTTDTGSSATDGVTNVGTMTVVGVEATASWQYSTDSGTTWSAAQAAATTTFTVPVGSYAINAVQVRQTDLAGNLSATTGKNTAAITVDTAAPVAPTLALTTDTGSSATDGVTNVGTMTVVGVEATASWQYSTDSGTTWSAAQAAATTTFTVPVGSYAINAVQVRQTDLAGNLSATTGKNTAAITVDTAAPVAPTLALTTDTGSSATDGVTNVGTMTVVGVEATASWQYSTDSGTTWSAAQAAATTTFTVPVGSYAINAVQVRQTDLAGNLSATTGKNTAAITVDTAAPVAPTLALTTDTGSSATDGVTNVGTMTVVGVEATASWQYSTDSGTTWSAAQAAATTTFTVPVGSYAINAVQVRQTDLAGNLSATTGKNTAAITVDTAAPVAPTLALTTDTGSSATDGVTNVGTMTVVGVEATASWQYSTDSGTTWSAAQAAATTTFTVPVGSYAINAVQVRQTDLAGNLSATTGKNTAAITVDTAAPVAPTLALTTDTGSSATDGVTNVGTMTVVGVEATASWQYSTDSGTTWSAAQAAATTTFTVPVGSYAINAVQVRQTDLAGNLSATTGKNTAAITVDTAAPVAPTLALTTDTGSSATDGVTNVGTMTVVGVEATASWQYSTDSGTTWSAAQAAATTTFTVPVGSYAINAVQVRQTDLAGNLSATTGKNTAAITVDTAAPVAPTLALTTDTGSSATDGVTNVGTMTVVGVEATASWQYSTDSGTTWSAAQAAATTTFTVPVGSYAINAVQVRQTDLAGNLSATTGKNTAAITVDTAAPVAPTLALTTDTGSSATDGVTNVGTMTVVGVEATASWQYSTDSGTTWSAAQAAATTTFTVPVGSYAINAVQVRQTDLAGNLSATTGKNTVAITPIVAGINTFIDNAPSITGNTLTSGSLILLSNPNQYTESKNEDIFEEKKSHLHYKFHDDYQLPPVHLSSCVPLRHHFIAIRGALRDQTVIAQEFYAFSIPKWLFRHIDPNEKLKFEVTHPDGSALPDWLQLNTKTLKFFGLAPKDARDVRVMITVGDEYGNKVHTLFMIHVSKEREHSAASPHKVFEKSVVVGKSQLSEQLYAAGKLSKLQESRALLDSLNAL